MSKLILFLTFLLILPINAMAMKSLDSFCRDLYDNRTSSKEAIQNKGRLYSDLEILSDTVDTEDEDDDYYRGCRFDTPWIKNLHQVLCSESSVAVKEVDLDRLEEIKFPKNILFFFEGAGDFNAQIAKAYFSPVNIDGSEGKDLAMGNTNGLSMFYKMLQDPRHPLKLNDFEFHYHASSGFMPLENKDSAIGCAKQTKDYISYAYSLLNKKDETKWLVMGYSNGGEMAIDFQNSFDYLFEETLIKFDLVLTVDPIVQAVKFPFHGMKKIGKRNENTKRFVNFYQNDDYNSLPVLKLRGKPVEGADENIHISALDNMYPRIEGVPHELMDSNGNKNHINIVSTTKLQVLAFCEFERLFYPEKQCSYTHLIDSSIENKKKMIEKIEKQIDEANKEITSKQLRIEELENELLLSSPMIEKLKQKQDLSQSESDLIFVHGAKMQIIAHHKENIIEKKKMISDYEMLLANDR